MLVLFETPAGFALFKVLDEGKVKNVDALKKSFNDPEKAQKIVKLKAFDKFANTQVAMQAATALVESKLSKPLKEFLKREIVDQKVEELAVIDKTLGGIIKEKLDIPCVYDNSVLELIRGIRYQMNTLLSDVTEKDFSNMALGLSHSLSRYKLKFSPDKVDTMIVQAISLLDDLDKELNIYAMRVKEWYGWHFPELSKIVGENILYAKTVMKLQNRNNAAKVDLTDSLPEELASEVKDAALISMGTEVSETDMLHICALAEEVIGIHEYRAQLFEYLKNRMQTIAPNLTHLVGELIGARLIARAGSLLNLAKHPASTVQILGAEKALFRALKAKHNTPKFGLLFHASLIGGAPQKLKGKIARTLAAKCAISSRVDALGEKQEATIGIEAKEKIEERLRNLEGLATKNISGKAKGQQIKKPTQGKSATNPAQAKSKVNTYDNSSDFTPATTKKRKADEVEEEEEEEPKPVAKPRAKQAEPVEEEEEEQPKPKKQKVEQKPAKKQQPKEEEEEEEKPKKKEEKPKKKQQKDDEEEEEEEKPKKKEEKPKKKQQKDEEEEDKPVAKPKAKKQKVESDEEEEEKPKPKKAAPKKPSKPASDDEEEEEKPKPKKAAVKKQTKDEDDEDEKPAKSAKKPVKKQKDSDDEEEDTSSKKRKRPSSDDEEEEEVKPKKTEKPKKK